MLNTSTSQPLNTFFQGAYAGKKVLVTGHTGFKGSWLSMWLKELGAEVIGYSLEPPSDPSNFEACALESRLIHIHGDVRDYEHLLSVFKEHEPEFVFHLAAQPLVRQSYQEPLVTYETNVMGTAHVLEAVRATETVHAVINVTSDKCYENREWVWGYRENDPVGGHDPYSSSKGCAELVTTAYLRSFFSSEEYGRTHTVGLASARAGNVIGGGDWGQDRLIPDCIRALSHGKEVVIRNPNAIRPWQHVLEPLYGYLLLGAKLREDGAKYCGAWNFGPMDSEIWSVEDMVKEIIRSWGEGNYRVESHGNPHEAHWLKLDCSKAKVELAWRAVYSLEYAVEQTISWYRAYNQGRACEEMRQYAVGQIEAYAEAASS